MPSYQDLAENMKRLAALGLELHVDHFEISVPLPASEQNLQRQAAAYHSYLSTCLAVATCKAFLTWGFTDRNAWAPNRWPGKGVGAAMPFDREYQPKPAYKAMLDALKVRQRMRVSGPSDTA
jgi:endo-1,4-beta-xylanase